MNLALKSFYCGLIALTFLSCAHSPHLTTEGTHTTRSQDIEQLHKEIKQMNAQMRQELRYLVREELLPEIKGLQFVPKKVRVIQDKVKKSALEKIIVGRIEWIKIQHQNEMILKARVDSGAKTCSMHAKKIVEKEIDGKSYVQFETVDNQKNRQVLLKEVVRMVNVINTSGETTRRYVIKLNVQLGESQYNIHVNLNDREDLTYNFLIGRNLLMKKYLVDVTQSQLLGDFK